MSWAEDSSKKEEVIDFIGSGGIGSKILAEARTKQLTNSFEYKLLTVLDKLNNNMEKLLYEFRLVHTRRGESYGNRFVITTANNLIQIDLKHPELSKLPAGLRLNLPQIPLPNITLLNEGDGNLLFDAVGDESDTRTTTFLGANNLINMDFRTPVAERLNLRCDDTLTLNMMVLL